MSDSFDDQQEERQRESAKADRRLLEALRQEATPEHLREEWDRARGVQTRGAARRSSWREELAELWVAISSARVPQMTGIAAAMLLILVGVWLQFASDEQRFRTPDANLAAGGLPPTLRVSVRAGRTTLEDTGRILSALLNSPRRGAGISVFDVDYSGTNAQGNRVSFKGTMVVTNAAGVVNLKNAKDISGILLDGDFTIGNLPPVPIRQPFVAIP